MYQFQFRLDDGDYLEFNRHHQLNAPASRRGLLIARLMVPAAFAVLLLLALLGDAGPEQIEIQLAIYAPVSIAWFFLAIPLNLLVLKLNLKLLRKHGKLPYGREVTLRFEEDFFIETTEKTEMKTKYSAIERIALGERAIYIYISALQAVILPFAAFEAAEQRDAFLAYLHDKAAPRADS